MKTIILTLSVVFLFSHLTHAQVGVNTNEPKQEFHVHTGTTTDTDVVFTSDGRVGVGTIQPDNIQKLHVIGNVKVANNTITKDTVIIEGTGNAKKIGVNIADPTASLHIANTGNQAKLRISDGTEATANILTSDADGNTFWSSLAPMSSTENGALLTDAVVNSNNIDATSEPLYLSPGLWLVGAKASTINHSNGNWQQGFYMYIYLYAEAGYNGTSSASVVSGSGAAGEQSGSYASSPNLLTIVNVPVKAGTTPGTQEYKTKFWIQLSSARYGKTTENLGKMQFYAVRIDRPD